MNYPKITKIIEIKNEAKNTKTLKFDYLGNAIPGQFLMIWIPGVDEIPMSLSYISKETKGITFRVVGDATQKLYEKKIGDKIGIRGPFGNGFKIQGEKILFVGGGTGIAMLTPAIQHAKQKNIHTTVVLGVKNKDELFFEKTIKKHCDKLYITTDDGSYCEKGFCTDIVKKLLQTQNFDNIYTCGPELMMKNLIQITGKTRVQASLERYMKCAAGICGQCCIGKGLRVCKDGPIFDSETLKKTDDFGRFKRDASGQKIKI